MRQEIVKTKDRIKTLLACIERGEYPDRARLEETLTDGYACALSLDAECDRLERRLSEQAARLGADSSVEDVRKLSALARLLARRRRELDSLRDQLGVLRAGAQHANVA